MGYIISPACIPAGRHVGLPLAVGTRTLTRTERIPRCRRSVLKVSSEQQTETKSGGGETESLPVRLGVAALTQLLKIAGVGQEQYEEVTRRSDLTPLVAPGDVAAVISNIREDFEERAYFITGNICEGIYAEDCFFGDPTVQFTGLRKWQRNLQLLVPFLEDPRLDLDSIGQEGTNAQGAVVLKATWKLMTYLKLPWRPYISILGSTEFTLNESSNQIVRHIEAWNVSGLEAVGQMFKASDRTKWPKL